MTVDNSKKFQFQET